MSAITMQITMEDDGVEIVVDLPAHYEICSHCQGRGQSSAHLGAFTRDEMDEQGPEFIDDYMTGAYDRPCEHCENGKVLIIDEERCASDLHKKALAWLKDMQQSLAEERAIVAMEIRSGA